jgi:hypothetical protein
MIVATNLVKPDNNPDQKWSSRLTELKDKIRALVIQNADDLRLVNDLKNQAKAFIQQVGWEKDPIIQSAKDHVELLKKDKAKYVDPAEEVVEEAAKKMAEYNERKRLETEAETRRINEEKRIKAQREADELKRQADERARVEREAAQKRAAEEKAEADRIAEENRKAAAKKAEAEQKAREKELEEARERGLISAREQKKAEKEAAEKAAADKKAADAKAEADKKAADEKAERERKQAEEDEKRRQEQAERDAQAIRDNVKEVEVKREKVTGLSGYRGGGTWKVESFDFDVFMEHFLEAHMEGNTERRAYLRALILPDEQEIGRLVRVVIKNKEQAEALIPGVVVKFYDR